jgi:hypothetical protein
VDNGFAQDNGWGGQVGAEKKTEGSLAPLPANGITGEQRPDRADCQEEQRMSARK